MRTCPQCGGEIRPSVIRCVHCGAGVAPDLQPMAVGSGRRGLRSPVRMATAPPTPVVEDPPERTRPPEAPPEDARPAAELWVVLPDGAPRAPSPSVPVASRSARHVDGRLLSAAVLAIATAVIAVSALSLPWVHANVAITGQRSRTVADLTLRAFDAYGGTLAIVVAVATGFLGLLWFWCGMDLTNRVPAFAHPAIAIVVGLAGWAAIVASMLGSFLWERGLVASAPEAGLTPSAMQAVLDDVGRRVVEIERLAGCQRFAVAVSAAVVAGVVGLWSQRPRRTG